MDYHDKTYDSICPFMGYDPTDKELRKLKRRPLKNTNFGLIYGMQEAKLARQNGMDRADAAKFFKAYHEANPYVRPTMEAAENEMQKLGYITTILGRKTQFNFWEPMFRDFKTGRQPGLPFEMAIRAYGSNIKRAGGHKAINYRLQGSNADQIKKGMVDCYNAGVFDATGVPRLQVHDELDFSVENEDARTNKAFREMRHILETCIPFIRVPIRIDFKRGQNWAECD